MLAAASEPPLRRSKRKRTRALPVLILHKEVGKGQGSLQSFPFPSLPLGHAQVITCGHNVCCALAGRRAMTLKGAHLYISILYSCLFSQHPSRPDAIVCVDACFMQKHNQQIRDPAHCHPHTVFITEADVQHMENYVDGIHPVRPHNKKKKSNPSMDESTLEDGYEGLLRVPMSILDGCKQSFLAADDQREKASTQFFASTMLIAILCCHDRVLWVVNMWSVGEKQHYILVLLEILFQHLPLQFAIGLLYNIGCQTHCSCMKWDFLKPYHHQLIFGISVFHAFGHQWPCQVIYHPHKCKGFGFSDGEGCEHFWHSISKLITYL